MMIGSAASIGATGAAAGAGTVQGRDPKVEFASKMLHKWVDSRIEIFSHDSFEEWVQSVEHTLVILGADFLFEPFRIQGDSQINRVALLTLERSIPSGQRHLTRGSTSFYEAYNRVIDAHAALCRATKQVRRDALWNRWQQESESVHEYLTALNKLRDELRQAGEDTSDEDICDHIIAKMLPCFESVATDDVRNPFSAEPNCLKTLTVSLLAIEDRLKRKIQVAHVSESQKCNERLGQKSQERQKSPVARPAISVRHVTPRTSDPRTRNRNHIHVVLHVEHDRNTAGVRKMTTVVIKGVNRKVVSH
jgi:hypothetical protein